jgi:hypothetical protein
MIESASLLRSAVVDPEVGEVRRRQATSARADITSAHAPAAHEATCVLITFSLTAAAALTGSGVFAVGLRVLGYQWLNKKTNGYLQGQHAAAVGIALGGIVCALLFGGLACSQLGLVKHVLHAFVNSSSAPQSSTLLGAFLAFAALFGVAVAMGHLATPLLHAHAFWQQNFDVL